MTGLNLVRRLCLVARNRLQNYGFLSRACGSFLPYFVGGGAFCSIFWTLAFAMAVAMAMAMVVAL